MTFIMDTSLVVWAQICLIWYSPLILVSLTLHLIFIVGWLHGRLPSLACHVQYHDASTYLVQYGLLLGM